MLTLQAEVSYTSVTVSVQQHLNTGVYLANPMKQSRTRKAQTPARTNADKGSILGMVLVETAYNFFV